MISRLWAAAWAGLRRLFGWATPAPTARFQEVARQAVLRKELPAEGTAWHPARRRLIYWEERLLPKLQGLRRAFEMEKPSLFLPSEARRRFSPSLRNRDYPTRLLATDPAQLQRLGLPLWRDEEELAAALRIDVSSLRFYACHRQDDRFHHYIAFEIPKRRGGQRQILAPKSRLKALQRRLHELLVGRLPISSAAHGFRVGHSVRSAAAPHVGKAVLVQCDLKDFFLKLSFGRIRGYFLALGYGYPVATTLALLCTEAERQKVVVGKQVHWVPVGPRYCVQGAPTSPGLANALARRLDLRLLGLAKKFGWTYTRYADDLIFSSDEPNAVGRLLAVVRQIAANEGFPLNPEKTRVAWRGQAQRVCGVTVNDTLGLSRQERRRLRARLHRWAQSEPGPARERERQILEGHLAWVRMLDPEQAKSLAARAGSGGF